MSKNKETAKITKTVKLSTKTSLQSLISKGERAAAIAEAHRREPKIVKKKVKKISEIERTMQSVRKVVNSKSYQGLRAVFEQPGTNSTAYAVLNFYIEDFRKSNYGSHHKSCPVVSYVFYASVFDKLRMGSISIYGPNARIRFAEIAKSGHVFGLPVRRVSVEMGLRPFVEVKL